MAESGGQDVTSQQTETKLGLTTFTFRSQRYQIPSVIVKEKTPDDPTGEDHMCVMLDVGFGPHCNGPYKEMLDSQGAFAAHTHGGAFGDSYHSLERQVRRSSPPLRLPPPGREPPSTDPRSLQEVLVRAMAEHSQAHSQHSASQPSDMGHRPQARWQHSNSQKHQYVANESLASTEGPVMTSSMHTNLQQQHSRDATDSPQFTVRHSVKQSSASYSSSSPATKPKVKAKPGSKSESQVSNISRTVSLEPHETTTEEQMSHPGSSMPRSDYGSMEKTSSRTADIEDDPGENKRNNAPSSRRWHTDDRDSETMMKAFGFEPVSQATKRKGRDNASQGVARKVTRVETYNQDNLAPRSVGDYGTEVGDNGIEKDLIPEQLHDVRFTSEDESSFREEFFSADTSSLQYKKITSAIPSRVTHELSGSSDVLSVDSQNSAEGIGLEKGVLGDSFIGNVSEQPMLHESSPEVQVVLNREQKTNQFKRAASGSSDDLDDVVSSSGVDASEGDESPRSISPEIDLDIALESAETEVFSGDATLGRVFSVRSEKRQYSLVKVYSQDKKHKSRERRSKASSSSSMENIIEEEQAKAKSKTVEKSKERRPNKNSPSPGAQPPQWPSHRQPSPETVFENIIENLETSGVDWTSDYESDQKDERLSGGALSPASNGVTDTSVDNEIKSLDFLGADAGARRTSSCECVVDHLTQDTESSIEPVGSSIGTRDDSADFSDSDSDGSHPNLLEPGGKSVEQIIDRTRSLTDSLLAALDKTGSPEPEPKTQTPPLEIEKPPPVPKRTYVYCETSFVGDDRTSSQVSKDQSPQKLPNLPDMDRIYNELSERERKRESPPREQESHLKTTKEEQVYTQEMLSSYDEICSPKSPVIHMTPVYAKVQRLPQFLAEELSHTITNTGEAMELESEKMRAEQYQNYQEEIERRIPDIQLSAVPTTSDATATRDESLDSTDIDAEFEDNLRVCSQREGDGDASSDLGSIMDGIDGAVTPEPHSVETTALAAPENMEKNTKPEVLKQAYEAAKYVSKLADNTTLTKNEVAEKEEKTSAEVADDKKANIVDSWTRSTSDASTNVTSYSTKDSLTKDQAKEFIQMMMGKKTGSDQGIQTSLSQVCQTSSSNKQVVPSKDEEVKSEEITTQEVTLVFSWPKKKGVPVFPKTETPFREIFLHRVTRITDVDTKVVEGPTIETIEYGKSKGKISGAEYERQRSLKETSVKKSRKALPPSTVKVMSKSERSTQSDVLTSQTSKFAEDVEEIQVVSSDQKTTTISTQTVPARYINVPKTERSIDVVKPEADSPGIAVSTVSTAHTDNLTRSQGKDKSDAKTGKAEKGSPSAATTSEVVHELTDTTARTESSPTSKATTAPSNGPFKNDMAYSYVSPSAADDKRSQSSSSDSSHSGSTGSVVDLHAQRTALEVEEQEYEETFPTQEELENVVEQLEVPPQLSEAVGCSTNRIANKAKVETSEDTTIVEEFFQKSTEREVKTFCEQYVRDNEKEREGSGQSDDIDDGALEGMRVMYPRDSARLSSKPELGPSVEHVEIRNVSTQHLMQSLQKRMETLGYEFPMPAFEGDSSKAKEQHLDIVWTEQERSILEDAIHSSKTSEVMEVKPGEVKPKEVYEIDGRQFFKSTNSVDVSFSKETKTKTNVKDVPLLTKVRLITYMSDAERELIKSLIEFCRIIEGLGDQSISGRTLDVIPEGLELTVQPGVNYADCLPSPESRKHSQLHSPSSVEDSSAEKAFEDTLAVIEKTKQFVNDTDFNKPGTPTKPFQNGLRDSRTPSTDDDVHSVQCTRILELERSEQDVSDSSEDTGAPGNVARRVSVSGLYRDLIDVVMPLKTEKNITHCLTTESRSVTELTTEKRSKACNVLYETSFVGQRTDGVKPGESKATSDTDSVSTVRNVISTTAHGSQVLHVPKTSEHGQDTSSVNVSTDECPAQEILSTEHLPGAQRKGMNKAETSPHNIIPQRKDMDVDLHAIIIQPSGVVKQETLSPVESGCVSAQKPELSPVTVSHYAEQTGDKTIDTATEEMSTTRIALVDRQNRVRLRNQKDARTVTSPKKTPPPVPPRPGRRPPPVPPRPASRRLDKAHKGGSEEIIFLVKSDDGNKYEAERTQGLSSDESALAETCRTGPDAARRAFISDNAIEKLALVGVTVEDTCQRISGTVPNQHSQRESGETVAKMDGVKKAVAQESQLFSLQPRKDTLPSSGTSSPLSPDTNCNVQTTNFVASTQETTFADMLYAELFACKVMQDSLTEMEEYMKREKTIRDRCEISDQNDSHRSSDCVIKRDCESEIEYFGDAKHTQDHEQRLLGAAIDVDGVEQVTESLLHTGGIKEKPINQSSQSKLLPNAEQNKEGSDKMVEELPEQSKSGQLTEDRRSEKLADTSFNATNEQGDLTEDYNVSESLLAVCNEQRPKYKDNRLEVTHSMQTPKSENKMSGWLEKTARKQVNQERPRHNTESHGDQSCKDLADACVLKAMSLQSSIDPSSLQRKDFERDHSGFYSGITQTASKKQGHSIVEVGRDTPSRSNASSGEGDILNNKKSPHETTSPEHNVDFTKALKRPGDETVFEISAELPGHERNKVQAASDFTSDQQVTREDVETPPEIISGAESAPSPSPSSYATFVADADLSSLSYDSTPDPDDILVPRGNESSTPPDAEERTTYQQVTAGMSSHLSGGTDRPVAKLVAKDTIDSSCSSVISDVITYSESDSSPCPPNILTFDFSGEKKSKVDASKVGGSMELTVKPLAQIGALGKQELPASESAVHGLRILVEDTAGADHDNLPYKPLDASAFQLRDDDDAAESRRCLKRKASDLRNLVEEQNVIDDRLSTIKDNFAKLLEDVSRTRKQSESMAEKKRSCSVDLSRLTAEFGSDSSSESRAFRSKSCDNIQERDSSQREASPEKAEDGRPGNAKCTAERSRCKTKSRDIGTMIFNRVHSEPTLQTKRPSSTDSDRSSSGSSLRSGNSSPVCGSDTSERRPRRRMYSRRWSDYNISQEFLDRDQADRDSAQFGRQGRLKLSLHRRSHNKSYQKSFYCYGNEQRLDEDIDREEKARLFKQWFYKRYKERERLTPQKPFNS